jgi:hypothetical protein
VKPEELYADGWAIGYDERFPKSKRIQQALLFARFSEHDNLYAHPMVYYLSRLFYIVSFVITGFHTGHRLESPQGHPH